MAKIFLFLAEKFMHLKKIIWRGWGLGNGGKEG